MTAMPAARRKDSPWVQTAGGRALKLLDPRVCDVDFHDVAEHLAKLCRFTGAVKGVHYSVAQHSCLVSALGMTAAERGAGAGMAPNRVGLYGLLHDAHEAYTGDLSSPLKAAIRSVEIDGGGRGDTIERIDRLIAETVHLAASLRFPPPAEVAAIVKFADLKALATEKRDLIGEGGPLWSNDLPVPDRQVIKPWPWPKAAEKFLETLTLLRG